MAGREQLVESINCMSRLLTAIKDCFIQKREIKDEIINIGSTILLADLQELREIRESGKGFRASDGRLQSVVEGERHETREAVARCEEGHKGTASVL